MQPIDDSFLRSALDAMMDPVLIKGPESRLLWANKAFLDYYGMTEETLRDIVDGPQADPDDTLQYVRDDARVFATGAHVDVRSEIITDSDGVGRPFHTIKSPIFADGQVIAQVGVSRLIDDEQPEALGTHPENKALTRPLRALSQIFPIPLVVVDVGRRIVACSDAWAEHFDRPPITPETSVTDLAPIELQPLVDEVMATGQSLTISETIGANSASPDQRSERHYDFRVAPWYYSDDSLGGVLVLATEVTDHVRQSQLLIQANRDLEHFAHAAAHDLRDPARRQRVLIDLLLTDHGETLPPEVRRGLEVVRNQSDDMLSMIGALRTLTNLTTVPVQAATVDLQSVTTRLLTDLLEGEEAEVRVELPRTVTGYPPLIEVLMRNLLLNAVQHGSRPLVVEVSSEQRDGRTWFTVSNRWQGPSTAIDDTIFDAFGGRRIGGTNGLGLHICKRVVDHHLGAIVAEASGNRFTVAFTFGDGLDDQ